MHTSHSIRKLCSTVEYPTVLVVRCTFALIVFTDFQVNFRTFEHDLAQNTCLDLHMRR